MVGTSKKTSRHSVLHQALSRNSGTVPLIGNRDVALAMEIRAYLRQNAEDAARLEAALGNPKGWAGPGAGRATVQGNDPATWQQQQKQRSSNTPLKAEEAKTELDDIAEENLGLGMEILDYLGAEEQAQRLREALEVIRRWPGKAPRGAGVGRGSLGGSGGERQEVRELRSFLEGLEEGVAVGRLAQRLTLQARVLVEDEELDMLIAL